MNSRRCKLTSINAKQRTSTDWAMCQAIWWLCCLHRSRFSISKEAKIHLKTSRINLLKTSAKHSLISGSTSSHLKLKKQKLIRINRNRHKINSNNKQNQNWFIRIMCEVYFVQYLKHEEREVCFSLEFTRIAI